MTLSWSLPLFMYTHGHCFFKGVALLQMYRVNTAHLQTQSVHRQQQISELCIHFYTIITIIIHIHQINAFDQIWGPMSQTYTLIAIIAYLGDGCI